MGIYRIDTKIYPDVTDAVADYLESVSQYLSETVASKLGSIVMERTDPVDGDRVFVYRYSTAITFAGFDKIEDELLVAAISSELLEIMNTYPPGTKIRPMRLAFAVPANPKQPNNMLIGDTVPVTSQIVWVTPSEE